MKLGDALSGEVTPAARSGLFIESHPGRGGLLVTAVLLKNAPPAPLLPLGSAVMSCIDADERIPLPSPPRLERNVLTDPVGELDNSLPATGAPPPAVPSSLIVRVRSRPRKPRARSTRKLNGEAKREDEAVASWGGCRDESTELIELCLFFLRPSMRADVTVYPVRQYASEYARGCCE